MPVLHLFVHSLIRKSAQNNLFNCDSDATLEGTLYGGVNVEIEGAL